MRPWRFLLVILMVASFAVAGWLAGTSRGKGSGDVDVEGYPPGVRFVTVALGGFRGLLADGLWLRAAQKQDEGRYFEVAQLSEWISRLEPRYPEIWSYHAWNLAYNIGAMFPNPADRWQWIQRGVRLLRDEGIPANPRNSKLYWDLGWLYSDKISGRWDDDPLYNRVRLASDMTLCMGAGSGSLLMMRDEPERRAGMASEGLSLDIMRRVEAEFGPLDWRLPETHALYWGYRGRSYQDPGMPWCDRLVWTSLTEMIGSGALYFEASRRLYVRGPRLDLARQGVHYPMRAGLMRVPLTGVVVEHFLREAMVVLFAFGDEDGAEEARVVLAFLPGVTGVGPNVRAAVRLEVENRLRAVNAAQGRDLVMGFLSRGEIWRGLGNVPVADGFIRMGGMYRDALKRGAGERESEGGVGAWESMINEARERAAATLAGGMN